MSQYMRSIRCQSQLCLSRRSWDSYAPAALAVSDPDDGLIAVTGCSIGISDKEGWTLFVVVVIMETSTYPPTTCLQYRLNAHAACSTYSFDYPEASSDAG